MAGEASQARREVLEVVSPLREEDRRSALLEGANHIVEDELVAPAIGGDRGIELLDPGSWSEARRAEGSLAADQAMLERALRLLALRVDGEPDGTALHVDDGWCPSRR